MKESILERCHGLLSLEGWSTGQAKKDKKSPLHLHNVERHSGRAPGFGLKVTGVFGGDALKRQVRESVTIQLTPEEDFLNRRDEWRQYKMPQA